MLKADLKFMGDPFGDLSLATPVSLFQFVPPLGAFGECDAAHITVSPPFILWPDG